ncbi:unnamed protein product [Penicillium salamii]|nr:unnamed protein product [Penicillium salamii]
MMLLLLFHNLLAAIFTKNVKSIPFLASTNSIYCGKRLFWKHLLQSTLIIMSSRYERIGNIDDLEAAISRVQDAIQATPLDHPNRAGCLNNLSHHLSSRYERTGNLNDLEAAISRAQDAVKATPLDHPNRAGCLNNLSYHLSYRYERTGNLDDLEAAISRAQDAVQASPSDHPDRAARLNNLSNHLSSRYERTRNLDDLEAAISRAQDAVQATPLDHPNRAGCSNNLSNHLSSRYQKTGNIDDLEAAISRAQDAVQATPLDHPNRAIYMNNLSGHHLGRYEQTGNLDDLETAIAQGQDAVSFKIAFASTRVTAARRLLRILTKHGRWDHASSIAESTTELLPLLCSRHLSRQDQQYAITQTAGLAADISTIFHHQKKPNQALQHLEFGRGLILGYLIDSRSDIDQLHKDHPRLATEYDYLRRTLSQLLPSDDSEDTAHLVERKKQASRELEHCLHAIRQESGYTRFLLEPEVHTLTAQAADGPLVAVNTTDLGSHASIVVRDQIHSLELPQMLSLRHSGLNHQLARFRAVGQRGPRDVQSELEASHPAVQLTKSYYDIEALSWLWDHCVKPILEFVDSVASAPTDKYRIWWMGTGAASSLPFHAAGHHDDPLQGTMSRAISSYMPTIKALSYSRSQLSKLPAHDSPTSLAIMTMPTTPRETSLPGIASEIEAIEAATAGSEFTLQVQRYPRSAAVLQAMQETDIIHFACHGSSDAIDPSESHLLLQKDGSSGPLVDRLTVQKISDRTVERARIAFLSACSTAEITAGKFTDEAIHLASAFQVAGFGHVIASLWSVKDAVCAPVAYHFYHHLAQQTIGPLSNRSIAEALHGAVLKIRETESPTVWASFVHYGA